MIISVCGSLCLSVCSLYLLLRSFAVRLIGSCDTVLAVLESMLATFISPISTTLMTQSFLLMIQRNGTMFYEILRHQQALWVSTQTGIKRRSKILELEMLQEQSILTIEQLRQYPGLHTWALI